MFLYRKLIPFLILFGLAACKSDNKASDIKKTYFDIRGFFAKEANRLAAKRPAVQKSISDNGSIESRKVRVADWGSELSLFSESDINKPSWRNSYRVSKRGSVITYTAKDSKIRTQKVTIRLSDKSQVSYIAIRNQSENMLYSSNEMLEYYPDSLYRIVKQQNVKVLGSHRYLIEGRLRL